MLLALVVVIVHAFRPVVIRLYVGHLFCLVFSKKFNIMSAFSVIKRTPCRKKSILAKVVLMQKKVSMYIWQNEYLFQ